MGESRRDQLLNVLDKYNVPAIIIVYLIKVYGSLYLYLEEIISAKTWEDIHIICIQILFIMFFFRIRKTVCRSVYSAGMGLFTSRLVSQSYNGGFEFWFEIPGILIFTIIFYHISKKWNLKT